MKNTIKENGNGTYDIKISFDITEHGHDFGIPRNYPLNKVHALIRSKSVQNAIKSGYSLIMYGHGARDKFQGYLANERNAKTGEVQEPIGRVTSLSIRDKIITYTAILVETEENKAKSVYTLIKNEIGGFSFVWDIDKYIFYGIDYVLSPNFNGNRVVMDSICSDGGCKLEESMSKVVFDAIGEHDELFSDAYDLLLNQEETMDAINLKNKFLEKQKKYEDEILNKEKKIRELEYLLDNEKNLYMDSVSMLENKLEKLNNSIVENGLTINDGIIEVDKNAFGDFFIKSNSDEISFDEIDAGKLLKPKKEEVTFSDWRY